MLWRPSLNTFNCNKKFGKNETSYWSGLYFFQLGGVIFF